MSAPRRAMKVSTDQELRVPSCGGKRKQSKRVAEVGPVEVIDGYEKVMLEDGGFKKRWRIGHRSVSTAEEQGVQGVRGSINL